MQGHNRGNLHGIMTNILSDARAKKGAFPPLSFEDLIEVLGLTIKKDNTNKIITFFCQLNAYTTNAQFNISFNSPSSTGKSYLPLEIVSLFPEEDRIVVGYCSPTAFFHDVGEYDTAKRTYTVNLSRKILLFLDQPHTQLLQHLRPLLSHDKKEISIKITDKAKNIGMRTKNIIIKGFPAVIFCSAGLRLDEQEATRFFLLSPEISQEKIREAIYEKIRKESDFDAYVAALKGNPKRQALKERIKAIKDANVNEVKIRDTGKIEKAFFEGKRILKPRHARDIGRLISLIKACALLNLWHRECEGNSIISNDEDINQALVLWRGIAQSQELNLPMYVYNLYIDIVLPLLRGSRCGIDRQMIIKRHFEVYERPLADWQLRREILPLLEMAGLIFQVPDVDDKRKVRIVLSENYSGAIERQEGRMGR